MGDASCHGRSRRGSVRGFLVAVLLASACSAPPGKVPPAPTGPLRGLAPTGEVSLPLTFEWENNSPDAVVRVSIEDRAQRPVFGFSARGAHASAPAGLDAVLVRGEPFFWTVSAVDENNETSRTSAPIQFRVK
jgi:hypothetical protein